MSLTKQEMEADPSFWQDYSTWSESVSASDEELDRWAEATGCAEDSFCRDAMRVPREG